MGPPLRLDQNWLRLRPPELFDGKHIEGVVFSTRGTKMASDTHLVPLSTQAVALLKEIHKLTGRFELVFPSDHAYWKPMSENTVNKVLRACKALSVNAKDEAAEQPIDLQQA